MCFALESILANDRLAKVDCALVDFADGSASYAPILQSAIEQNYFRLDQMMDGRGAITKKHMIVKTDAGYSVGPRNAARMFTTLSDFGDYTDVIVDISSLPMSIYFPLIGKILNVLDSQAPARSAPLPNLHVMATENTRIDKCISKFGLSDEATYLYGFTGDIDLESEAGKPLVWIPILGEDKTDQIVRISDRILPREICPVLPSPSANPRRGDNIVLEYRDLLNRLRVETSNIIYAAEQNPFETYRQIYKTIQYYRDALKPLRGPRFVISPLSSKLASIGAFLVAYEEGLSNREKVGIAYVESAGYEMNNYSDDLMQSCELSSMWIFGDCYDV